MKRWPGRTDPHVIWDQYERFKGSIAFDIGANIGQIAKKLAPNFKTVYAFEPCEESYLILRSETPENVIALNLAVTSHNGPVTLYEASESIQTGQLVSHEGLHWGELIRERVVLGLTLDDLVKAYDVPDFIKVDTEGHEAEVIKGGLLTLENHRPQLLIEVHNNEHGEEIRQMLPFYDFTETRQTDREESMVHGHYWLHGL